MKSLQRAKIRRARIGDVRPMHKMLGLFSERRELLPRAISELYENIQQFHVADDGGRLVGCCSLAVQWDNLAEVKALAVDPDRQGQGIGRRLVDACLDDARALGITRVFALTMKDGFFSKIGFRRVEKNHLPHKVWTECVRCPYFPETCVEIAMVKDLGGVPPAPAFKAGDLPSDGTVPVEPEGFAPVKSSSEKRRSRR
ncbi:MAG: N-acetyltransferase [Elusimicrobia bacterium]|nr:N-acetyltransferase [Elusimicrobiota bacterium]MBP9127286.1 N-acetyltransferase [Elusimicrobiota bacterium]MBP9698702.1 N-acetyltransferase [Elusimicrobiota bacterium]